MPPPHTTDLERSRKRHRATPHLLLAATLLTSHHALALDARTTTWSAHARAYQHNARTRNSLVHGRTAHLRTAAGPLLTAAAAPPAPTPPAASLPATVINLAKNIVGSGVLALAFGVASYSPQRAALAPATGALAAMCALSAYTFSTIARVSGTVGATSYREAWSKVFGARSALLPNAAIIF